MHQAGVFTFDVIASVLSARGAKWRPFYGLGPTDAGLWHYTEFSLLNQVDRHAGSDDGFERRKVAALVNHEPLTIDHIDVRGLLIGDALEELPRLLSPARVAVGGLQIILTISEL